VFVQQSLQPKQLQKRYCTTEQYISLLVKTYNGERSELYAVIFSF